MQAYVELLPPSAVTHAIALPFLSADEKNLVVVKTSLLQVFKVQRSEAGNQGHGDDLGAEVKDGRQRLVLVGEYPLSGTVTGLAAVTTQSSKSGGEVLLISLKDAKLSLVEWDPENHRISTISIHYYEGDNVVHEPFGPGLGEHESILTVDPSSRCAALKFGARQLAILPFRQSGDDLIMEGADDDADGISAPGTAPLTRTQSGLQTAPKEEKTTPYKSSFVLPITALEPTLKHPVDIAFLHEYREPTFGILSAPIAPSASLAAARKDVLTYSAFSVDLEQRASTNLVSVSDLPSDLFKVIPLSLPVGGALLVGINELVHVDQSGKTVAVAVNEFATMASALSMADQSSLGMKLEGCEIIPLDSSTGEMLVTLKDGGAAILSFRLLGRNIGSLSLERYVSNNDAQILQASPSCAANLDRNAFFVGSEEGDSSLLSWSKQSNALSRKRSHAQMLDQGPSVDDNDSDEDLDEDDLYATAPTNGSAKQAITSPTSVSGGASSYSLRVHDIVPSTGPINAIAFGKNRLSPERNNSDGRLHMAASIGRGKGSRFATIARKIDPSVRTTRTSFDRIKDAWSLRVQASTDVGESDHPSYDNMFFAFDGSKTEVYDIVADGSADEYAYSERIESEFEEEGETLLVDTVANGRRLVQCRRNEIRTYDSKDLALSQIIPMVDDETDAELSIMHISLADPWISVLRDDGSLLVLRVDEQGDVEPLDLPPSLVGSDRSWQSSCIYAGSLIDGLTEPALVTFNNSNGLQILSLPYLTQVYQAPSLAFLPAVLTAAEQERRRGGQREHISEVLLADLGDDDITSPYMLVRCGEGGLDLVMYEPYFSASSSGQSSAEWPALRFRKMCAESIPVTANNMPSSIEAEGDSRPEAMRPIRLGAYSAVTLPGGEVPSVILRTPLALPKVLGLGKADSLCRAIIPLNRPNNDRGFGLIRQVLPEAPVPNGDSTEAAEDRNLDGETPTVLDECQWHGDMDFSSGWCVRRHPVFVAEDETAEVRHIVYHEHQEKGFWVLAACHDVDFDVHGKEDEEGIVLRPRVPQCTLHLLSTSTLEVVHSLDLPYLEVVTDLKTMHLEVSELTHATGPRLVVSTGAQRGEDAPARGVLYVFETLDVVPDPGKSGSGIQLHLISREETKGAVTALHAFPGGLIGTAQGQKLMVRGLKEDGSCLPVAFLDAQAYTVSLRTLGNSGLWLAADAAKGIWFGGFTQEPYRLTVLGKSRTKMEVLAAEMLPFDGGLFICVVDGNLDLQVLQYDPENPKSLSGMRLLHRSTFHLGHVVDRMQALPSTLSMQGTSLGVNGQSDEQTGGSPPVFQVLTTSPTGSVGLISPLDETAYRRLGSLQTHLSNVLEHAGGLNPRAFRSAGDEASAGRGVIDGTMIKRIWELGSARRAEVLARAGSDSWVLQNDLEHLGGIGLPYV